MSGDRNLPLWRDASFRAISAVGFAPLASRPDDFGPAPELKWVRVADLVIDTSYQRDINSQGVRNIREIAAQFSWAKFGAVIVAPCDEKFSVLDGQHRVTAAALLGIAEVPAQIVAIDRQAQAAAFSAINIGVTRVHQLYAFAAALAAGDDEALQIEAAAHAAGVKVCRYPKQRVKMEFGETLALNELKRWHKRFGAKNLTLALSCLTHPKHNRIGGVNFRSINVACRLIADHADMRDLGREALQAALATFDARTFASWLESCEGSADAVSVAAEIANEIRQAISPKVRR